MSSFLEFHDSTLAEVVRVGASIRIGLNAYVHRWEIVDGTRKGSGYMQDVTITLVGAAIAMPARLPVEIQGGELRAGQVVYRNLVPLPFVSSEPASLRVDLVTGEGIEINGEGVSIEPFGPMRELEDLPDELAPPDFGG